MVMLIRDDIMGRHTGTGVGPDGVLRRVELRVDAGSADSLDILSGDLWRNDAPDDAPPVWTHVGSFWTSRLSAAPEVADADTADQTLSGPLAYDRLESPWGTATLALTILRDFASKVVLRFWQGGEDEGAPGLTLVFSLSEREAHFRAVTIEVDVAPMVVPPAEPKLTWPEGWGRAGVSLSASTFVGTELPRGVIQKGGEWQDDELYDVMATQKSSPSAPFDWSLYLLLMTTYYDDGVLGVMFDVDDAQPRQGAAVFCDHPLIAESPLRDDYFNFTVMHELGHAFNLPHCFEPGPLAVLGGAPRPTSLTWMNYPSQYPMPKGGAHADPSTAFWSGFGGSFDREELAFLRHGPRALVAMGGAPFGGSTRFEDRSFETPTRAGPMSLSLVLPKSVEFLESVEGMAVIRNRGERAARVGRTLLPTGNEIELRVLRPGARLPVLYRPPFRSCAHDAAYEPLAPGGAAAVELTPSLARGRWLTDEPGTYELQASYRLPGGGRLVSEVARVRVEPPTLVGERLAADYFTPKVVLWHALRGSRSAAFERIEGVLQQVADQLRSSRAAAQILLTSAARDARPMRVLREARTLAPDLDGVAANLRRLGVSGLASLATRPSMRTASHVDDLRRLPAEVTAMSPELRAPVVRRGFEEVLRVTPLSRTLRARIDRAPR